jgi:SPP1 gp7 family putative phage head morphogenesis protein
MSSSISVSDDPDKFQQAIKAFRKKVPMPETEWDLLDEAEREFAFKVGGVAQADVVTDVWLAIDKAIDEGTSLDEFKATVGDQLEAAWGEADPARIETIFRTNTQTAYTHGRHEIFSHPQVKKARPYWRWDDVDDSREDDLCAGLHGVVLPADDPFWDTRHPPLHFNCRCIVTPLSVEEAEDEGIADDAPDVEADDGFGRAPSSTEEWEPDLSDYPEPIAKILGERLR